MNSPLPTALGALALVGVSFATTIGEHLDGVIRIMTLSTVIGQIVAYRRYQAKPGSNPFPIITRWSGAGLLAGIALQAVLAVS